MDTSPASLLHFLHDITGSPSMTDEDFAKLERALPRIDRAFATRLMDQMRELCEGAMLYPDEMRSVSRVDGGEDRPSRMRLDMFHDRPAIEVEYDPIAHEIIRVL